MTEEEIKKYINLQKDQYIKLQREKDRAEELIEDFAEKYNHILTEFKTITNQHNAINRRAKHVGAVMFFFGMMAGAFAMWITS